MSSICLYLIWCIQYVGNHICTNLQPSACIQPGCRSSSHILHWAGRWWWWPTGSWRPAGHSLLNRAPHWSEEHKHRIIYLQKVGPTPPWLTHIQLHIMTKGSTFFFCGELLVLSCSHKQTCTCLPSCQIVMIHRFLWKPNVCASVRSDCAISQSILLTG